MVVEKAAGIIGTLIAGVALANAAPLLAHDREAAPDIALCDSFPAEPEAIKTREEPLQLPEEWADFATSSKNWIAVRTDFGVTHCVDTAWFETASDFERLNEKFVGFAWEGYEAWGYTVVHLAGQGASFDTGARPVFSPSGDKFAALQVSDAGWGGFEGFAVWRTYGNVIYPIAINTRIEIIPMVDWRIERWEGEDCLHISAVEWEDLNNDWKNLASAKRHPYVAGAAGDWAISPGQRCPTYGS